MIKREIKTIKLSIAYFPVYSPIYAPIENCFAIIKSLMKNK